MSLIEDRMQNFVILNKSEEKDSYGSYKTTYTEGATFRCSVVLKNVNQLRRGFADDLLNTYVFYTHCNILKNQSLIKCKATNTIYKISSNLRKTPSTSSLDLYNFEGEEWKGAIQ